MTHILYYTACTPKEIKSFKHLKIRPADSPVVAHGFLRAGGRVKGRLRNVRVDKWCIQHFYMPEYTIYL